MDNNTHNAMSSKKTLFNLTTKCRVKRTSMIH